MAELARHFLAAAPVCGWEKAVGYSIQAGQRAFRLFAYEEAVEHYRRAIAAIERSSEEDERRRAQVLLWLGDAELQSGQRLHARESFARAADLAQLEGWSEGVAWAALGYARTAEWGRLDEQAIALLDRSLASLPAGHTSLRAEVQARLSLVLMPDPAADGRRDELSRQAVANGRAAQESHVLAFALNARLHATWGPGGIEGHLEVGDEILSLAMESGDLERRLEGHHWRLTGLLDQGDMARARAEIDAYALVAQKLNRPQYLTWAVNRQKMLALLAGRFGDAEDLTHQAYELGRRAEDPQAEFHFRLGMLLPQEEQGRLGELEAALPGFVEDARRMHGLSLCPAVIAHILMVLGRKADARAAFEALAVDDFQGIRRDLVWMPTTAWLSEVATFLGDTPRATTLYELLFPYQELNVMASAGLCLGAAGRYLGILAGAMARWDEACGHYECALELNDRMGARPWLAHTQHDYACALLARDRPGDAGRAAQLLDRAADLARELGMTTLLAKVESEAGTRPGTESVPAEEAAFRREGDYWSVLFDDRVSRVKDSKGMRYLSRLLTRPEVEIHVLDLVAGDAATGTRSPREGGFEVLDARAKAAYRRRIEELRGEVAEADSWNDPERASRAREELEALAEELTGAVGLSGRDRRSATSAERARVSVTRAIRNAIGRLEETNPALARHLDNSVRTGTFCSYAPEPRVAVRWAL